MRERRLPVGQRLLHPRRPPQAPPRSRRGLTPRACFTPHRPLPHPRRSRMVPRTEQLETHPSRREREREGEGGNKNKISKKKSLFKSIESFLHQKKKRPRPKGFMPPAPGPE